MSGSASKAVIGIALRRSSEDAEFRRRLLATPNDVLRELDPNLASGVNIQFVERPSSIDELFVLPSIATSGELAIEELETVAGGDCPWTCIDLVTCIDELTESFDDGPAE